MMATSPANHVSGPTTSDAERSCAACGHAWSAHDTISARFCAATTVGRFTRGCVCTNVPLTEDSSD
jgi:hypothetical protein